MSKKTRQTCEDLDLFSIAGLSEHTFHRDDKLKSLQPVAKPNRTKQKKATSAASVEEAPNERYLRDSEVAQLRSQKSGAESTRRSMKRGAWLS